MRNARRSRRLPPPEVLRKHTGRMLHQDFRRALRFAWLDQAVWTNDPDFTIQHKTGKGVGHPVQPKNFKANILCQRQHGAKPADDAALAFATFLRRIALQYDAGAGEWGEAEEITISGDDMQRWVLKLFLNHAVTGHFDVQQDKTVTFPPEAIDLLLDRAAWPSNVGFDGARRNKGQRRSMLPVPDQEVVNSHWWGVAPFVHKDETWIGGG